jgi:hypothetical protein
LYCRFDCIVLCCDTVETVIETHADSFGTDARYGTAGVDNVHDTTFGFALISEKSVLACS